MKEHAKKINCSDKRRLDEKFREAVFKRKGMRKGNITEAIEEAIECSIKSMHGKEGRKSSMSDDNATRPSTTPKSQETEEFEPLFSEDEVRKIVKSFVTSWVSNETRVVFPSMKEIKETTKRDGEKINDTTAQNRAAYLKTELADLISICAGRTSATSEQQRKAMYELFYNLFLYRAGNRIEGKFIHNIMEERLCSIEENIKELNTHFEELYFYVKSKLPDDSSLKGK